ncbi:uncharacterized protein LOC115444754 [Manduca sexta]|uniref:uncharacterized protein LOC115444754 n=1 Tax=Manduca sexta TaxID=7130 RepID=UPI0011843501|nr:uncharacterized protein LOC115444754 [Manduca sexta]
MMPPPPPPPPPGTVMMESPHHIPPDSPTLTVIMNVVMTGTHIVIGAVSLSAFLFSNIFVGTSSMTQHIQLCVFGYVILMSQAILTFSPHSWANSLMYPKKKIIHLVMQVVGSLMAIVGSIIRFASLTDHLQSAHGILGFIAFILTVVSLVGGVMNLIFPKHLSTLLFRLVHICVGILTISVAFLSLCFGFNDLYRTLLGDINANLSISLTIMALCGVLSFTMLNLVKKFNRR